MSNGDRCEKHDNYHAHCQQCCREEIAALYAALEQSNRYIDEAVSSRVQWYEDQRAKYGRTSPEAAKASHGLHELINGTRNSFDSVARVLAKAPR